MVQSLAPSTVGRIEASWATGAARTASEAPVSASSSEPAGSSTAPRSAATSRLRESGSYPATAPAPARLAASPTDEPISPVPRSARRSTAILGGAGGAPLCRRAALLAPRPRPQSRPYSSAYEHSLRPRLGTTIAPRRRTTRHQPLLADLAAHQRSHATNLVRELRELRGRQLLRAVAQRLLRPRMHLDDDPVRADGCGRAREREHQLAPAGRMRGIDDHGQVGLLLEDGHRAEVERVPRRALEGLD